MYGSFLVAVYSMAWGRHKRMVQSKQDSVSFLPQRGRRTKQGLELKMEMTKTSQEKTVASGSDCL